MLSPDAGGSLLPGFVRGHRWAAGPALRCTSMEACMGYVGQRDNYGQAGLPGCCRSTYLKPRPLEAGTG